MKGETMRGTCPGGGTGPGLTVLSLSASEPSSEWRNIVELEVEPALRRWGNIMEVIHRYYMYILGDDMIESDSEL